VNDEMKESLGGRDFARAIISLTLLGRDEDVAKLVSAMLKEEGMKVAPDAAAAAIPSLQRVKHVDEIARLYAMLPRDRASNPVLRDVLWQALYPQIADGSDSSFITVLAANLRDDQPGQDAATLAPAMARAMGNDAALGMLKAARVRSNTDHDKGRADEAIKRLAVRGAR
jgi:hypothetical protein